MVIERRKKLRRRVGKLYQVVVNDGWMRSQGRDWVLGYRQKKEGGHFNFEIQISHGEPVVYLKKEKAVS